MLHNLSTDCSKKPDDFVGESPLLHLDCFIEQPGRILPGHRQKLQVLQDEKVGGGRSQLVRLQALLFEKNDKVVIKTCHSNNN